MKFHDMKYERIDKNKLTQQINELITSFQQAQSGKEQIQIHQDFCTVYRHYQTMLSLVLIRHSQNVDNAFYNEENEYMNLLDPYAEDLFAQFYQVFIASPYLDDLKNYLGQTAITTIEMRLKSSAPAILDLLQEENQLTSAYDKLIANAQIKFNDEILNLSQLQYYMLSDNREVRKTAYQARSRFFKEIESELDRIYDSMVNNRHKQAQRLGYENYTQLGYIRRQRNSYDQQDIQAFRKMIKQDLVPYTLQLHEKRKNLLGLQKLKYYDEDMYFKKGNPKPTGTPDKIFQNGRKMYSELSSETKQFIHYMLDNELFDCLTRRGKSGGGYCDFIQEYQSPFVFANFNGTSKDIDVLTHECGHAFNAYLTKEMTISEHLQASYDIFEIHSMSMEFFTSPWMNLFFDNANEYRYMHLLSTLIFIPYGCMVDEFQEMVYDNPTWLPSERKKCWQALEKEYKPYLDYEDDEFFGKGGRWQAQAHIYSDPFYYIDYALAQTVALMFRCEMEEDYSAAWEKYIQLSKKGGKETFVQLVENAGLDSPLKKNTFESLLAKLKPIINKYEEKLLMD